MEKKNLNGTENQTQESNGLADLKNENEVSYYLELCRYTDIELNKNMILRVPDQNSVKHPRVQTYSSIPQSSAG